MMTRRIIEAVKRRIKRGLKVLGLYLLWQTTGWTLTMLFLAILVSSAVKSIMAMPLSDVGPFDPLLTPFRMLHWHTTLFLIEHPTAWTVWQHLPGYDPANPFTLLTPIWGGVALVGLAGGYLVRKKVKDETGGSSFTIYGNVLPGILQTGGSMTISRVKSIAGHLSHVSSPAEHQVAQAIAQMTKAVAEAPTLDEAKRAQVLELFSELARQTTLPPSDRSRTVVRVLVGTLDAALNAAGNLADIWSAWGEVIKKFFGI
jgi:hypothetical protein